MNSIEGRPWLHSRGKRAEDLALTFGVLPFCAPPAIMGALAVRFVDGVNPLFIQQRVGYDNKLFDVYKIRTMPQTTENTPSVGSYKDPRRSTIGRFLSKLRIDEAPQLINVWHSRMSVVGPRALVIGDVEDAKKFLGPKESEEWLKVRGLALPGIFDEFGTQFYNGQIAAEDPEQLWKARVDLETKYVLEEASFNKDMEILRNTGRLFVRTALPLGGAA